MKYEPGQLQEELTSRCGVPVRLLLTDNRRRMVSARNRGGGLIEVRLQRIFLEARPEVLHELSLLIRGREADRGLLRRFADERLGGGVAAPRPRRAPAESCPSRHHDIAAYARDLNTLYLNGRASARVVWGRRSSRRSRRSIRFACYDPERNLVIVNRKLDSPAIPAYFVEYILFHELLHEVLGIGRRGDGRRDIHGALFKLMESTFPDFEKARRYEKDLCGRLESL